MLWIYCQIFTSSVLEWMSTQCNRMAQRNTDMDVKSGLYVIIEAVLPTSGQIRPHPSELLKLRPQEH